MTTGSRRLKIIEQSHLSGIVGIRLEQFFARRGVVEASRFSLRIFALQHRLGCHVPGLAPSGILWIFKLHHYHGGHRCRGDSGKATGAAAQSVPVDVNAFGCDHDAGRTLAREEMDRLEASGESEERATADQETEFAGGIRIDDGEDDHVSA